MANKTFPLSKQRLEGIIARGQPTPFYLYDERAIRENARKIMAAYSRFPGYINHFAVKAAPTTALLRLLAEEGFGADCSSMAELVLAERAGLRGGQIMFTSNDTPGAEFVEARRLGAVINLDDFTHIDFLERTAGIPDLVCLRYNPGPLKMGNSIIGNPVEAKYGFTREQVFSGFESLLSKGARHLALHTMVASNELNADYHIETGRLLFSLAAEVKTRLGVKIEFVNLGGGAGIPYKPEQEALDYEYLAAGLKAAYDEILLPAGLAGLGVRTEWGRAVTGPYGWLVTRALHTKDIYRKYIGVDACMADLMRPGMYGAYHHITVCGKENESLSEIYDVTGGLCENNDKFAVQRPLPPITPLSAVLAKGGSLADADLLIIHDAGAHGRAMGFNYNGRLRPAELLLEASGSVREIRRAETLSDYFATLPAGDK